MSGVVAGMYHRRAVAVAQYTARRPGRTWVAVLVTGSLARGGFGPHSDIDFLVTSCPRDKKYAIEGVVEVILDGIPFDVVYLDEIPAWKVSRFTRGAVDARDLR